MARPQRVFIDTSELFPFTIMDVLLTLSEDFLFTWVWTDELLDEWEEVIVREGQRTPVLPLRNFLACCLPGRSGRRRLVCRRHDHVDVQDRLRREARHRGRPDVLELRPR
ncbi:hypothetical protein GCM10027062_11340 [Nocardioides hungaricus]